MADDEDYGVATTLSGANEEILSGGEGFSRWKKKRSELETLAAQYEDALRERSQSPYADNTGGRLGQAIWAKNKLEESAPPRYSAVYDDEAKAEANPQAYGQGIPNPNFPRPTGEDQKDFQTPEGTGKGQFQPPPEQLGQPFNLSDAGRAPQGGAQGAPPPIRTFARNTETTPYSVAQRLEKDPAYQALGPNAKVKYAQLEAQKDNVYRSPWPDEKKFTSLHAIDQQMASLVHTHEEGEKIGAAKAVATIAGQQAQQVAQAVPIYSERQKQQISQLQQAEQQYRSMAASGNISQEAMQQGLQDVAQQLETIRPIGSQGPQKDPRFKPNQQPGMSWLDIGPGSQNTGKHLTRDMEGNEKEHTNERTLGSLGQMPAKDAHDALDKIMAATGEDDFTTISRVLAREAMIRGDQLTPEQVKLLKTPAHGKSGVKPGPGEAPMPEEKYHASLGKAMTHLEKVWEADQKPAEEAHGTSPGKKGGAHEYDKIDKDEWRHAELVKMGLATDGGKPSDIGYKQYMDNWNARHGQKQPGQPEQVGAPTGQTPPPAPVQDFVGKQIPDAIQKAAAQKIPYADVPLNRLRELIKTHPDGLSTYTPEEKGEYVEGMQVLRKIDPRVPEMTPDYIRKIGAILPKVPYHQREFNKFLNEK